MVHLSHYTKGLILLGVINLLVVLLIFLSPNNNLFSNENAITGMAVSGFTEATESSPVIREILISPKIGKVSSGGIFTVDVLANPALGSVNAKYYIVNLRFDGSKLNYNPNSVKSLKQGWTMKEKLTGTTTKTLVIEGTTTGAGLSSGITNLFELGFTAETVAQDTNVPILILIAGFKESKTSTTISNAITKKTGSTITITAPVIIAPVIIDNDGDGYSLPEDCDDDKSDDNDPMMQCPTSVLGCYEYIYQSGVTDIIVVSQKHKYCAICKNPGISVDYCDGIDNDCDGVVDGKTTMYENCPSGACAAASCPDSSSSTSICTETEQKLNTCISSLPTCSANECLNTLSIGGTSAGCDEKGFCITTGENCADKTSTIDFTIMGGKTISYQKQTCNAAGTHKLIYSCKSTATGALTNMGMQKVSCLLGCSNGECVTSCPVSSSCPTEKDKKIKIDKELTPACGDGSCQVFENYITCKEDCIKEDICNPAKPNGNANYCLIDTNSDGVYDNDLDKDGLSNEYEVYLEVNVPQNIKSQQNYKGWYDMNLPDTDMDGVLDRDDYCPGTITIKGNLEFTIATGQINLNGCYVGDVAIQGVGQRPDGCLTILDTNYLLDYYISPLSKESCTNLYGNSVK